MLLPELLVEDHIPVLVLAFFADQQFLCGARVFGLWVQSGFEAALATAVTGAELALHQLVLLPEFSPADRAVRAHVLSALSHFGLGRPMAEDFCH
jgi:hypothetical protein